MIIFLEIKMHNISNSNNNNNNNNNNNDNICKKCK